MKKMIVVLMCVMFSGTFCFAGVDDNGCFYADDRTQIEIWNISTDYFSLVRDDGREVVIISSPTDSINIADPNIDTGEIAAYFAQNITIPAGTYTHFYFEQGDGVSFKGCIQIGPGQWKATGQAGIYDNKDDALTNAVLLDIDTFYDRELVDLGDGFIIEDGKSYTLKILWQVSGTDEGDAGEDAGVGLIWDPAEGKFTEGLICEEHIVEEV